MIQLGSKVKDRISGFTGVAVARTEWLYGCARITVQPHVDKDGKLTDTMGFDEPQLEVLEPPTFTAKVLDEKGEKPGGPRMDPRKPDSPSRP